MEKGQIVNLRIEDISQDGKGIGKVSGLAVFVSPGREKKDKSSCVKPVLGDLVQVEITKVKKNFAFAEAKEILEFSEDRMEGLCPYENTCGGCIYTELSYPAQLELKEKQVKAKLSHIGGVDESLILPIVGMEIEMDEAGEYYPPIRYRNKASMPVSTGGLITEKGGVQKPIHEPRIGFYMGKSHFVVDCQDCMIQSEPAMAAAKAVRQWMEEDHITSYDPRWEKGLMRHLIVRTAAGTGDVMVILVINGKGLPNGEKLVSLLDDAIYQVPVYEEGPLAGVEWNLKSVILNVNRNNSSEILGKECITLAGRDTILEEVETMDGEIMRFEISPLSFYQVNREMMVKLYDQAIDFACLKGGETVLDLYCGVGTIGLFAAKRLQKLAGEQGLDPNGEDAGMVIGIESVKGAVVDANRNATINGITRARYFSGKAEEELPFMMGMTKLYKPNEVNELKERKPELTLSRADVAFIDPPRSGCDEKLLEAVVKAEVDRIVYVSCDAATLARDVKWLEANGYRLERARPFDMFPHTGHVETCCLLRRRA